MPMLAGQSSHHRRKPGGGVADRLPAEPATSTVTRPSEPVPYTLAELRAVVSEALAAGTCPYCSWAFTGANFSVDHHNPISRDGAFSIANVLVCHLRCNKIKGNLTSHEFLHLAHFPPEVGKGVLARLYAGGRFMRRP